jgi:hypothetical protein
LKHKIYTNAKNYQLTLLLPITKTILVLKTYKSKIEYNLADGAEFIKEEEVSNTYQKRVRALYGILTAVFKTKTYGFYLPNRFGSLTFKPSPFNIYSDIHQRI